MVVKLGSRTNLLQAQKLYDNGLKDIHVSNDAIYGRFLHNNIRLNSEDNISVGTEITEEILAKIIESNIKIIQISNTNSINKGPYLLKTMLADKNNTKEEAITDIYKILRPGEPPTFEIANQIFQNLFLVQNAMICQM